MANYKILLVDDDKALRNAVHAYLEAEGYFVLGAHTGKTCREFLEQERPDAVVMDYSLPDTNGLQLLGEIHGIDPSIPVIIMTGYATIDLAVHAMKEGAEQFVAKPFESSVLLKLLENVFENRRVIRRELAEKTRVVRFRRDPFLGTSESIRRLESSARSIPAPPCRF